MTKATTTTKTIYGVAYKNWRGEWVTIKETFTSKTKAEAARKTLAKTKAENGRATVFIAG